MPKSLRELILVPTPEMVRAGVEALERGGEDLASTVEAVWKAMRLVKNRPGRPLVKPAAQIRALDDLRAGVSTSTVCRLHGLSPRIVNRLKTKLREESSCTS